MASIDLPDVNVWLALSSTDHVHHDRAATFWSNEAADRLAFNTVTMLGLVRIESSAAVQSNGSITVAQTWRTYLGWRSRADVVYLPEPKNCSVILGRWINDGIVTSRTCTDAYLAAFAVAAGARVVSFDKDFTRFNGLDLLLLRD